MGQLIIPAEDPNSLEPPTPVHLPGQAALTWTDFHPEAKRSKHVPPQQHKIYLGPQWRRVTNELESLRARFIEENPIGVHSKCSNIDRSAVLAVYNEALVKLEHTSSTDTIKIHLEAKSKISTILDLRKAAPDDAVFYTKDAFLSPLEPQYAQPRLDYYDRGNGDGDDSYYRTGFGRLREWRKGGWPKMYPKKAIKREMREWGKRRGKSLGQIHRRELLLALTADPLDWGEEIDADPDRPWK